MPISLPRDEFNEKLNAFLKEAGPNPGVGFYGQYAWYTQKRREFMNHFDCVPVDPPSTAHPGSFADFVKKIEQ